MSYEALKPPADFEESDVDSIQSSPQLNTESHFAFNQSANSSLYDDRSFGTPFEVDNDSFREAPMHSSPYNSDSSRPLADFSYTNDETVGRFNPSFGFTPSETGGNIRTTSNSIKRQNRLSKPQTWPELPPLSSTSRPLGEFTALPNANALREDETNLHASETSLVANHNPDRLIPAASFVRPSMKHPKLQTLAEERLSLISNHSPSLLAPPLLANGKLPSSAAMPGSIVPDPAMSSAGAGAGASVNNASKAPSFSAPSFDQAKLGRGSSSTAKPAASVDLEVAVDKRLDNSTSSRNNDRDDNDDDDDDTLPFEATTKAPMDRPPSLALPSTIPVMSSQSFENYRRSVSSLKMLQRAARHPKDGSASGNDSDNSNEDDGDDDSDGRSVTSELLKEETEPDPGFSSTKEQRRRSAIMRQEQDARMSVYRQKMTKIIGSSASSTMDRRSIVYDDAQSIQRNSSSSDQDLLDDIPLSILQAHRFPRARSMSPEKRQSVGGMPNRPASVAESPLLNNRPLSTASLSTLGPLRARPSQANLSQPSLPPLPPLFGNRDRTTARGLVGAISREEEKKRHRRTVGYTETTFDEPSAKLGGPQPPLRPSPTASQDLVDMQTKLDHVINMLVTMNPRAPGPAMPYAASVNNMPVNPTIRPLHAPPSAAPSVRSVATRLQPSRPPSTRPPSTRPPSLYSLPSLARQRVPSFRSERNSLPPQPSSPAYGAPSERGSVMGVPASSTGVRGGRQLARGANRPSQMRIVTTDSTDDADDDDEWEQLAKNRQALKEEWSKQELSLT